MRIIDADAFERRLMFDISDDNICDDCLQNFIYEMMDFPQVKDVAQVRHGRWLKSNDGLKSCSVCCKFHRCLLDPDFCPKLRRKDGFIET